MIGRIEKAAIPGLILVSVIVINVALFSVFPLMQKFFSTRLDTGRSLLRQYQTVIEYREPEKKKESPVEQRIRQIANPSSGGKTDPMNFKFTPDLSVEGSGGVAMEQQDLQAVVFEEGETDEAAVPLYRPAIPFPERAQELEIKGVLEAEIIVGTDGKVESVDILKTPHSSFTSVAKKVITTWRFKPARNKGIPVKVRVRQVIEFNLE